VAAILRLKNHQKKEKKEKDPVFFYPLFSCCHSPLPPPLSCSLCSSVLLSDLSLVTVSLLFLHHDSIVRVGGNRLFNVSPSLAREHWSKKICFDTSMWRWEIILRCVREYSFLVHTEKQWFLWFYEEPSPTEEPFFRSKHFCRFFEELFKEMVP